ncbi:hypothetical protein [Naasia lichenicola]|uniref:Uncharacterized protein n=1 Tax=Naasia lichenicola TaxID=2565933 RepID=A0A4S4FQW0_9MICO|nr:hypothetical protein [Naasia lichenicola]THG33003.1 hypothetical protein E6C64_01160 [Naasia lichenicola]
MARADTWHPVYAAYEDPPWTFTMISPQGRCYGSIVMSSTERNYVVTNAAGSTIATTTTLMEAVEIVHRHYVLGHSPSGPVNGDGNTGSSRRT